jgi:hypothetical protein
MVRMLLLISWFEPMSNDESQDLSFPQLKVIMIIHWIIHWFTRRLMA